MAPQLDEARRLLIKTLLKKGFDTKLIASKALCSVRTVQRIRRERDKLPTRRSARRGRRNCITAHMQQALHNKLAERSDMYQCEMADFIYRKFRKQISERSIGRTLRSIGWTRKTIRRIAQQRDADLRNHYLHRISQYESHQLIFVDESGCDRRAGYRR